MPLDATFQLGKLSSYLEAYRLYRRYSSNVPKFVVVLGMHRSGTSCATRILNLAGASFGRTVVDEPAPDNGEIHWESANSIWINNHVLAKSGGSWSSPPEGEIRFSRRDRWRCQRFLWEFSDCATGLFKDPRMLLAFDLWKSVLPEHVVVACIRHPLEVARSLGKRDGIKLPHAFELWRHYNSKLLDIARNHHPVVWFDFNDGHLAARRMLEEVSRIVATTVDEHALAHFTADARHHDTTSDVPPELQELYQALVQAASARVAESQ